MKARFITLFGIIATIAGALGPYLDLLPPSWRTPIMLSGVLATACGPALFGPRGFNKRRRQKLLYRDVFPQRGDNTKPPDLGRK